MGKYVFPPNSKRYKKFVKKNMTAGHLPEPAGADSNVPCRGHVNMCEGRCVAP